MKNSPLFLISALIFFLAANPSPVSSAEPLKVITTLFPLQEFARAVAGERAGVDLIIPPGAEPHTWEPKPGDVGKILKGDVFIYIGPAMEPWAETILKSAGGARLKVVEASQGLPLLQGKSSHPASGPHGHGHVSDPHIWLDFSLDMKIVDSISAAFAGKDPSQAAVFQDNAQSYKEKLALLDKKFQSSLAGCPRRQIILGGHSAFSYLARRYGLEQIPLYGVSVNSEPTPRKLAEVIQAARKNQVKYLFFEELVNPKLARVLAEEAGLQTLVLHDGANLTRDRLEKKTTFLQLMEENLQNLRRGLGCEGQ